MYRHDNKKCETCGIKYEYCDCFLEYSNFKDDLIEYKCLYCNKNYQQKFDKMLKQRLFNTYKVYFIIVKRCYPYIKVLIYG